MTTNELTLRRTLALALLMGIYEEKGERLNWVGKVEVNKATNLAAYGEGGDLRSYRKYEIGLVSNLRPDGEIN